MPLSRRFVARTRQFAVDGMAGAGEASPLNEAQRIEIYGIGSSAPIAQDLSYRLLQLGLSPSAAVDLWRPGGQFGMTGPTVATVTVSHSGSGTVETVLATQLAREAGA